MRWLTVSMLCVAVILWNSPAAAQDTVMFNYQGRVKVQGTEFEGEGQFKFAILSPDQKSVLWTNDGTSNPGGEPTTGINLTVTDGVFNVVMGANGIMEPINSTIFQNREPLKLRTWFDDGIHGFEALQPDHNLINVTLITSTTGSDDFVIYVNGETGSDSNSGLKQTEPKKTIQGAVDIVPARIRANVTIKVAAGTYPEEVVIYGVSARPGKMLKIVGDETWTPSDGGTPSVIVTGDGALTPRNGLIAEQCSGIEVTGICFENTEKAGIHLENGKYYIRNCLTRENLYGGVVITNQARSELENVVCIENNSFGIAISTASRSLLTSCTASNNIHWGLFVSDNSTANMETTGDFSNNGNNGIHCIAASQIGFSNTYSNGKIISNGLYGIQVGWMSYIHNLTNKNTISGNAAGPTHTFNGSYTNY